MDLKKIDWVSFKRYTNPQAVKDLDRFLDAIPMTVGYNALIAASITCMMAGTAIFFVSGEIEKISKMHTELFQIEALRPPVPVIQYVPVSKGIIDTHATKITETYKGVRIVTAEGSATVTAEDTDYFPQFLAAISTLQRGGKNWKVQIDTLCVGRACASQKLTANLKISTVRIGEPEQPKQDKPDSAEETK